MDDLETLVRDVLREHASDAPTTVPDIIDAGHRTTRWAIVGLSAAAVVALAVGIAVTRDPARTPSGPADTQPVARPSVPTETVPDGFRRTGYHDITLLVPEGLPTSTTGCVLPKQYVLAVDESAIYDCVAGGAPADEQTLTVTLGGSDTAPAGIVTHATTIGGLDARIGQGALPPTPGIVGVAVFPSLDIAVTASAADQATIDTILTSVELGADPQGCPAHRVAPDNASSDVLVPPGATSGLRCVYGGLGNDSDVLLAADPVRAAKLGGLVDAINALPSPGRPKDDLGVFEKDLLRFDYPDGTSRTLTIDMSDPTIYSDGTNSGADDDNVVTDQLREAAP